MEPSQVRLSSIANWWTCAVIKGMRQEPTACKACLDEPRSPKLQAIRQGGLMPGTIDKKLEELGILLPTPAAPIANYVGFVRSGRLLFVSGQVCFADGALLAIGKLGQQVTVEQGQAA